VLNKQFCLYKSRSDPFRYH